MKKRARRQLSSDEDASIDLTPLIDVVFVVLILFIVIAPLLEKEQINLAPGGDETESVQVEPNHPIQIRVKSDNSIWLNKRKVNLEILAYELAQHHRKNPQTTPLLFHDKKAHFGTYHQVKLCAQRAGFEQLDLLLEPASR